MGRLENKVAIVTGAGSGIGKATARLFASEGARVVVADIKGAEQTAQQIGAPAVAVQVDVTKSAEVKAMVEVARSRFGRLDVLFNNAGVGHAVAPVHEFAEEEFDRVLAVNLKGAFLVLKYCIPLMLESGGGSVINAGSDAGLAGIPGQLAYCASKAGLAQLTRVAALDYARKNIRVNATCPGVIETEMLAPAMQANPALRAHLCGMQPIGRIGNPAEVAAVVLFLASDDSSYVTGALWPVDGGQIASPYGVHVPE